MGANGKSMARNIKAQTRLGAAMRRGRDERGWTLRQAAEASGLEFSSWSYLEKGERAASREAVEQVADALGVGTRARAHWLVLAGFLPDGDDGGPYESFGQIATALTDDPHPVFRNAVEYALSGLAGIVIYARAQEQNNKRLNGELRTLQAQIAALTGLEVPE